MKICFITTELETLGGQQKVLVNIANELSKKGEDVYILLTSINANRKISHKLDKDINLIYLNYTQKDKISLIPSKIFRRIYQNIFSSFRFNEKVFFSNNEIHLYERALEQHGFDYIVALTPRQSALLGLTRLDSKKIGWMHSTIDRYFKEKKQFEWNLTNIYKNIFKKLDFILVLTNRDKKEYDELFSINSIVMPNPLPFETSITSDLVDNKLIFVGRLDYYIKGLDKLVAILENISKTTEQFSIDIIGNGEGREKFISEVKKKGLSNFVNMVGEVENPQEYYLNASICLIPSLHEGFGLVVLEAMECGLPVVTFNNSGPSEIIDNSYDGFLIEKYNIEKFSDTVIELLFDKEKRSFVGSNAKIKSKNYSKEAIINKWTELLRD